MKYTTDEYASYIYVKPWSEDFKPLKTKELAPGVILDYNKDGELVGIEILSPLEKKDE